MYTTEAEFDITRRIGWSDDDLGIHIDEVFATLHQATGVEELDARADLDTGRTYLTMRFVGERNTEADAVSRAILGVAIRNCGGSHTGLLPFAAEAAFKPEKKHYSGLKMPMWTVRGTRTGEVSTPS